MPKPTPVSNFLSKTIILLNSLITLFDITKTLNAYSMKNISLRQIPTLVSDFLSKIIILFNFTIKLSNTALTLDEYSMKNVSCLQISTPVSDFLYKIIILFNSTITLSNTTLTLNEYSMKNYPFVKFLFRRIIIFVCISIFFFGVIFTPHRGEPTIFFWFVFFVIHFQ